MPELFYKNVPENLYLVYMCATLPMVPDV